MNGGIYSRRAFLKVAGAAAGGIILSSGVWGCVNSSMNENPTPIVRPTESPLFTVTGRVSTKFAEFVPLPVSVTPSLKDYSIGDVSKLPDLGKLGVSEAGMDALSKNYFYMTPSTDNQIYDVYKGLDKDELPAFVTADSVLHAYHILFDYTLRILEMRHFSPDIIELSGLLFDGSKAQADSSSEAIRAAAIKNTAFFAVALTLLGAPPYVPENIKSMVEGELSLIEAHQGFAESRIFGYDEDYSQYVPRGHYTRNDTLKKYFKAMMWYGRMMFRLKDKDDPERAKQQTRSAILITLALKDRAFDLWKGIYEPTAFFVGETDDLSVYDYDSLLQEVYGSSFKPEDLADDVKLQSFMDKALKLKSPKIVSTELYGSSLIDTIKGLRFMGQRFIPDSYMFQELVYDKVDDRLFPMGLDVMAVLGSKRAFEILDTVYRETRYGRYVTQMDSLKRQFASLRADDWTQNLYWCWLYCLMALLNEKGDGYPTFMKSQVWTDKELNASLGSWAELRHDTILYAKQSYTVKGISGPELPELFPPQPHGYVEPNPELYGRMASLAAMTIGGLKPRGLLDDVFSDKLSQLKDLATSLKSIAEKELTDQQPSKADYDLIRHIGSTMENLTTFPPEVGDTITSDTDKKMAVVADVHTDPNSEAVLEEGVGNPFHIFVVVPVDGKLIVAKGAAFSYYEFKQPMGDRLTDEKWQDLIANSRTYEPPGWTKNFTA